MPNLHLVTFGSTVSNSDRRAVLDITSGVGRYTNDLMQKDSSKIYETETQHDLSITMYSTATALALCAAWIP
jgi:hypothetical protein